MKKLLYILIPIVLIAVTTACEKELDTKLNGSITRDVAFKTVGGAVSAVNGIYQPLYGFYNGTWYSLLEINSDDAFSFQGDRPTEGYQINANLGASQSAWTTFYLGIGRANFTLAHFNETPFTTTQQKLKDHIEGQALFFRGLYYFNLVRLFGGVPIYTTELNGPSEALKPRNSIQEVYAQIEKDLNDAIAKLGNIADMNGTLGFEKGRATKMTARTVLVHVYLTQEKWADAARLANEVINAYALIPDYANAFQGKNELNAESILEVQYAEGLNYGNSLPRLGAPAGTLEGSGGSFAELIATNDTVTWLPNEPVRGNGLVQEFTAGDKRFAASLSQYGRTRSTFGTSNPPEFLCYKYWNPTWTIPLAATINSNSGINFTIYRYADVLLMLAEAKNEATPLDADAVERVNQIRRRAFGKPIATKDPSVDIAPTSQDQLRQAIRKERRLEFCFEAKRWFDLNRWGILKERVAPQKRIVPDANLSEHPITKKKQFLFPIPQRERDLNPVLQQNPGY
jgi:hypothetical protein